MYGAKERERAELTLCRKDSDSSDDVDDPGLGGLEIEPLPILVRYIPWILRSQP